VNNRANYSDDCEHLAMWRGAVRQAVTGKRGHAFLKDLLVALDDLPRKALIPCALENGGDYCAIGSVCRVRGLKTDRDVSDYDAIASDLKIAPALVREVEYVNDESYATSPEDRFRIVRSWVLEQIKEGEDRENARLSRQAKSVSDKEDSRSGGDGEGEQGPKAKGRRARKSSREREKKSTGTRRDDRTAQT